MPRMNGIEAAKIAACSREKKVLRLCYNVVIYQFVRTRTVRTQKR